MERYVKYLRKSRFDRDYAELSIEETLKRHEAILDKLAKDRGFYIVKTYYEVVSGESIAARPEIQKLLEEVNAGLYTGVLVVDLERLARGNGADQAYISQVFQFSCTKIITPLKDYDPSNEFDEEYFEFGLFMSRREYKTINRRLVRGRQSSASEGKYVGSVAPYGYDRIKLPDQKGFTLSPNENEAKAVQKIFELFTLREGTKKIANYLNDHHIPTRHGELWTYSTVASIISNPVYLGKIKRGYCKEEKSLDKNGNIQKRIKHLRNISDYQLYDGMHPALIDDDTFWKAQEIKREKAPSPKVKSSCEMQNAFCGLIYCSICGKRIGRTTMSGERGGVPRFRCTNSRNCHNSSADYYSVEKEIIGALRNWLDGYKVKIDANDFSDEIAEYKSKLQKAEQEQAALEAQLEKAFTFVEQGIYSIELFQQRRDKLNAEISQLREQRNSMQARLEGIEAAHSENSNFIPTTEALLASYDKMTPEEKNKLLKVILQRIEYRKGSDGKIEIDLYPRFPRV